MKEELVKQWLDAHPVLKEFDSKRAPGSPNPLVLLELIPDSFGKKFLEKSIETPKQFKIKSLLAEFFDLPCTLSEDEIQVTNHAYNHFIRALGLYAWKNFLTLEDRKNYAIIVKAFDSNYLFEKEEKGFVSPANSTWMHFARNVQNVIAMRPLEFVKHRKGASKALLEFFKEKSIIDELHYDLYLNKLGSKRAFEAKNQSEVSKLIKHKGVDRSEAIKLLEYVKNASKHLNP